MAFKNYIEKRKVSELPEATDTSGFWIFGSKTTGTTVTSVKFAFDKITSLFGVSQEKGQGTTLAPSLKLFTDEIESKADRTQITPDPRFIRLIDFMAGTANMDGHKFIAIQCSKSNGRVSIKDVTQGVTLSADSVIKQGKELLKLTVSGSNARVAWVLVDWGINVDAVYVPSSTIEFTYTKPVSPELRSFLRMINNEEFEVLSSPVFNDDGILLSYTGQWSDGTITTVTYSDYDVITLQYRVMTATYNSMIINFGRKTYNELGDILTKQKNSII